MEILGAGFCRTGTTSTKRALIDLGLGPCFHMEHVVEQNLSDFFLKFVDGDHKPLVNFLHKDGFKSALDFPICSIFEDLMPYFPKAKVLLNIRDSPDAWVKSFRSSVWQLMNMPLYTKINVILPPPMCVRSTDKYLEMHEKCLQRIVERGNKYAKTPLPDYDGKFTDRQFAEMYENWVKYVTETVPKDKLLIFNVKDGIADLAEFSGKPKPSWSMPHVNDSEAFNSRIRKLKEKIDRKIKRKLL